MIGACLMNGLSTVADTRASQPIFGSFFTPSQWAKITYSTGRQARSLSCCPALQNVLLVVLIPKNLLILGLVTSLNFVNILISKQRKHIELMITWMLESARLFNLNPFRYAVLQNNTPVIKFIRTQKIKIISLVLTKTPSFPSVFARSAIPFQVGKS